jgi:hypothetical protein
MVNHATTGSSSNPGAGGSLIGEEGRASVLIDGLNAEQI